MNNSRFGLRLAVRTLAALALAIATPRFAHAAPCPTIVDFDGDSASAAFDVGWTGLFHDQAFAGWRFRLGLASCPGSVQGSCGQCTISGLLPNVGSSNQRCVNDTSVVCAADADCGANGPCRFFAGPPTPVSGAGISLCVASELTSSVTGTIDPDAGSVGADFPLNQRIYSGINLMQPCPTCVGDPTQNDGAKGGSCHGGARNGLPCDANATSPIQRFGATGFDCPPSASGLISQQAPASKPVRFATGPQSQTLSAASPNCRLLGHTTSKCECDTCDNSAATPCSTNADCGKTCAGGPKTNSPCTVSSQCPAGACRGGTRCGGKRCLMGTNAGAACATNTQCPGGGLCGNPGTATAPNICDGGDLDCTASSSTCVGGSKNGASCAVGSQCPGGTCENKGTCATGPTDFFCGPTGTFVSCGSDADCAAAGLKSCKGGPNANKVCSVATECPSGLCATETCTGVKSRACFLDDGVLGRSVSIDGRADARAGTTSHSSLGALFCVAPTIPALNSAFGLPGLGRTTLPGTMTYVSSPGCFDTIQNGRETDVDCGGACCCPPTLPWWACSWRGEQVCLQSACNRCRGGQLCACGSDCDSGICTYVFAGKFQPVTRRCAPSKVPDGPWVYDPFWRFKGPAVVVVGNLFYVPAKLAFAAAGGVTSGVTYVVTIGNSDAAGSVWRASTGGDYLITPRMAMEGQIPQFVGAPKPAGPIE